MGKQLIKLTESDLHHIIKESVKRALNELENPTVASAMRKMRARGAEERANHLGDLAVHNYGGEELANQGYTAREHGGELQLGKVRPNSYGRTGSEEEDMAYDDELEKYNSKSRIGRMFSKKPEKPVDYGKPNIRYGTPRFSSGYSRTNDPKIASQMRDFTNNEYERNSQGNIDRNEKGRPNKVKRSSRNDFMK